MFSHLKIKKNTINNMGGVVTCFFVLTPDYIVSVILKNNSLVNYVSLGIFLVLFGKMVLKKKKVKFSSASFLILTLWVAYVTKNNKPEAFTTSIATSIKTANIILIVLLNDKKLESLLRTLGLYYWTVILINFVSIVFCPNGLYVSENGNAHYFLGYHNSFILFFLPALLISLLLDFEKKKKLSFILFGICFASLFLVGSTTSMLALILGGVIYILINYKNKYSFCNPINIVLVYIVCNVFILSSNIVQNNKIISEFIVNILGKRLDFTGRTQIWETSFLMILNRPLMGYGSGNNVAFYGDVYAYGHNQIVETLLEGGVIALLIFLICICINALYIRKIENIEIYSAFICTFISIFVFYLMEANLRQHLALCYALPYVFVKNDRWSDSMKTYKWRHKS